MIFSALYLLARCVLGSATVLDAAHAYTPAQRHQQQTDYMRWVQRNRGIRTES
jgi:hypothetical protein